MDKSSYNAEQWEVIPFASDYEISNLGGVRRVAREPSYLHMRALKPKARQDGYQEVTLYVDKVPMFFRIHQLVCNVFHGSRPRGKDEVGHIDGNPSNNVASNLRWVTKSENYADRNGHGTHNRGARNGAAKLDALKVQAVHILSERLTSRQVGAVLGVSKSQVGNILRGDSWGGKPGRTAG